MPPPPPGPPPSGPPPQGSQPPAPGAAGPATYTCPYCGAAAVNPGRSCPACGAPVDVRMLVSDSGWTELPPIRDMARIQFGGSHIQISGTLVPVADFNLAEADGVYFAHHMLLWCDPHTRLSAMSLRGGFRRMIAGLPVVMTMAQGPGHIALSRDFPGEMVALPMHPGRVVFVREHHFVAASHSVAYDWMQAPVWYQTGAGNDREMHWPLGPWIDVFSAQTPGIVLLHAGGNAFTRDLAPGQGILVQGAAVLYADTTVSMGLHVETPFNSAGASVWRAWSNRHLWIRLVGPGRVCVQSAYEHIEDVPYNIVSTSGYTTTRW